MAPNDTRVQNLENSSLLRHVSFRHMVPSDVEELKRLFVRCFPIVYSDKFYSWAPQHGFAIIAEQDGCVVGSIIMQGAHNQFQSSQSSFEMQQMLCCDVGEWMMYVLSLAVDVDYRRSGLGTKLLRLGQKHAQAWQPTCRGLALHVLCSNVGAVRFYDSHGLFRVARIPDFYIIKEAPCDAFLYALWTAGPPLRRRCVTWEPLQQFRAWLLSLLALLCPEWVVCHSNQQQQQQQAIVYDV